jgi:hypothetical protein
MGSDSPDDPANWIRPEALAGRPPQGPAATPPAAAESLSWTVPESPVRAGRRVGVPALLAACALAVAAAVRLLDAVQLAAPSAGNGTAAGDAVARLAVSVVSVVAAVTFIVWLYLAYANLEGWDIEGRRWSKGWAVGGWFIPLANWAIPKGVVDEVYSASIAPLGQREVHTRSTALIRCWWAAWVASNLLTLFTSAASRNRALGAGLSAAALGVAAVLGILVIGIVTQAQARRITALAGPLGV